MANPNPSPETRFQKGQSGNPSGRSKEEQAANVETAKISALLRLKTVTSLQERLGKDTLTDEDLELMLNPSTLKLLKDSEDRAHGTPKQSVESSGPDGGAIPHKISVETTIVSPED